MLKLYDVEVASRLLLGTARYPSPAVLAEAVRRSNTDIVTVSLRRETAGEGYRAVPSSRREATSVS